MGQLAKLSSKSAKFIEPVKKSDSLRPSGRIQVDPIIAQEFVETAKAIKIKQHQLLKQIIGLGLLFDMSTASLSKNLQVMTQSSLTSTE